MTAVFDPRVKLLYAVCMSLTALILNTFGLLVPLFALALMIAVLFCRERELPFSLKRMKTLALLFVMLALVTSVFAPSGRDILALGRVKILTTGGLSAGARLLLRMGIIMLSAAVPATEEARRSVQGLICCGLPYELVFMTFTALHFIPIFADGFEQSLTALKMRGVDFKKLKAGMRLRAYAGLLYPVVAGMVVKSQDMALAMEMRGFRALDTRVSYIELTLTRRDKTAIAVLAAATVILCAADILLRNA